MLFGLILDNTCELVCLDENPIPLEIGCRLTEDRVRRVSYIRASGEALRFVDGNFTHVICRLTPKTCISAGRFVKRRECCAGKGCSSVGGGTGV
jgi:hypothetical protein